jgi:hypothetical protein
MVAAGWYDHPTAAPILRLAEQSKDAEVRAKIARSRATADKKRS